MHIHDFIHKLDSFDYQNTPWSFRFKNFQAFEFGLDNNLHMNEEILQVFINKLVSEMDLVLLVDQYEESLLVLKEQLCLQWIDLWSPTKRSQNYKRSDFSQFEKDIIEFIYSIYLVH